MPPVLVDGHRFQSLSSLDAYIDSLEHGKEQFSAEQQAMEFYSEWAGSFAERGSEFASKVKKRASWKTAGWAKEDLDTLASPAPPRPP